MMTFEIRLSRYNPHAVYKAKSTWISISDVGSQFDDGVLDVAEYERVEQLYLQALAALLSDGGSPRLQVRDLHLTLLATDAARAIREGEWVSVADALEICRLELREELSCRLDAEQMYVHFGFDLYVYIGGAELRASTVDLIEQSGLFVEQRVPSPYSNT